METSLSYEEIEIKFLVDDLAALRQRVVALGATVATPRTYENNLCFDTPDGQLQQHGRLLRLRRDQRNVLTYKEPPVTPDTDFKVRQEYEIEVSDFAQARAIIDKLGFVPVLRYEKYRETFVYDGAEILLDDTPCGAFVELEGPRERLETLIAALALDTSRRFTASYGEIFQAVCRTYQLSFTDMTFANFEHCTIDIRTCDIP